MADGFALAEFIEVRLNERWGDGEVLVEKAEEFGAAGELLFAGGDRVLGGEEFDAVAGGEDEGLVDAGQVGQGAWWRRRGGRRGWRDARGYRGGAVV